MKQDWDPSIQAPAQFPDLVKQLAENIKWTTDLGNAFLAQQSDTMGVYLRYHLSSLATGESQHAVNLKKPDALY
jgi:hypothetical protein